MPIVEPELKTEYDEILFKLLEKPDCVMFKRYWNRLCQIDEIFKEKGLRTVITVSSVELSDPNAP